MKNILVLLIGLFIISNNAFANSVSLNCGMTDIETKPYSYFHISLHSDVEGDIFTMDSKASITATTYSSYGATETPATENIEGCLDLDVLFDSQDKGLLFECDEKGDMGFGQIAMTSPSIGQAAIVFPNGKIIGDHMLPENEFIQLSCVVSK